MSYHFLASKTYGAYADIGPGTILVDALADIHGVGSLSALSLTAGPWTITVNGLARSDGSDGIYLPGKGSFHSTVTVGKDAVVSGGALYSVGIDTAHATDITNAGRIAAHFAGISETGDGDFRIKNAKNGIVTADRDAIYLESAGAHTIVNAGTLQGDFAVRSFYGDDKVTNTGTMIGKVDLGDGNDVFVNFKKSGGTTTHGTVTGIIDLGAGNDTFRGGSRSETVRDGDGGDTVSLGGGKDVWIAILESTADGVDTVDGGKGIDTYQVGPNTTGPVFVNLGGDFVLWPGHTAAPLAEAGYAEYIHNFENAIGGDESDAFLGSGGANTLRGGGGDDILFGRRGADQLYGDGGEDDFYYYSLKDSGPGKDTRDVIRDFERGADHISLVDLSENLGLAFDFLGVDVDFAGNKGDLRAIARGANTIVQLDVNGDRKADFAITLTGHHALTGDDFYL